MLILALLLSFFLAAETRPEKEAPWFAWPMWALVLIALPAAALVYTKGWP